MFSLFLIILLLLMGGIIAYLGDRLGSQIGKARISLLNLRPRNTAILISTVTGALISAITLLILYIFFEDARIILTGLDQIKQELRQAMGDLQRKNQELASLEAGKKKLEGDIQRLQLEKENLQENIKKYSKITKELVAIRTGDLIFLSGEVLASSVIPGSQTSLALREGLDQILVQLDQSLKKKGAGNWRNSTQSFFISKEQIEESLKKLSQPKPHVLRLLSTSNVVRGEFVPITIEVHEVVQVYKKGEIIYQKQVNLNGDRKTIEEEMVLFLKEVNRQALQKGMLPDNSGQVGTITTQSMNNVLNRLESGKGSVLIQAVSTQDTTNAEMLSVELVIEE